MESLDPVPFRSAAIKVETTDCPDVKSEDYVMIIAGEGPVVVPEHGVSVPVSDNSGSDNLWESCFSTMKNIETGLAKRNYAGLERFFTPDGWNMFNKLLRYGDAKLMKQPQVQLDSDGNGMVCRSVPMSFSFKGNKKVFTEDVVFYLDASGKVYEVAFGLEQSAISDIMNRRAWDEEARKVMIHFLETYKTAYALKRLDYINTVFSADALIITGSVVKSTRQKEISPANMQHVKYTRQTKEQYMKSLKKCFDSNEFINIHFADNIVRRSNDNPNIYGIQIKQDYYSSTYGDTGYLFLLLDFKDPESPLIHVRTWQPDNDPNVRDGRIGIADFKGLKEL